MGFWPEGTKVEMVGKMGQEILEGKGEREGEEGEKLPSGDVVDGDGAGVLYVKSEPESEEMGMGAWEESESESEEMGRGSRGRL